MPKAGQSIGKIIAIAFGRALLNVIVYDIARIVWQYTKSSDVWSNALGMRKKRLADMDKDRKSKQVDYYSNRQP